MCLKPSDFILVATIQGWDDDGVPWNYDEGDNTLHGVTTVLTLPFTVGSRQVNSSDIIVDFEITHNAFCPQGDISVDDGGIGRFDSDSDGVTDDLDNCPSYSNPIQ